MTRPIVLAFALLCSTTLTAADQWHVSVLASEIDSANDVNAGVGVAVAYAIAPRWDVELAAATQSYTSAYTAFTTFPDTPLPVPFTQFRRFRVHPLELMATRHFLEGRRVAPYLRAGVRYVDAPDDPEPAPLTQEPYNGWKPVREGYGFSDRASVQAGAGLRVRLTANTALRADVTRALRSEAALFDPLTRGSLGLSCRF